nr:MAG TPA: hypothetical protein [Caudoviricetes sp.]
MENINANYFLYIQMFYLRRKRLYSHIYFVYTGKLKF